MKKIAFVAGLVLLLADVLYAQGVAEDKMTKQIAELNKAGIDTIMVWQSFYPVTIHTDTSPCYVHYNSRYLFWVHKRHNFITYIDECYDYRIVKDKLDAVVNILAQHLSEIVHQAIMRPTTRTIENGKESLEEVTSSDDAWFKYTFYIKGDSFVKGFSLSDLTLKDFDGKKNIYYDQNQQAYIKRMHDVLMSTLPNLKIKRNN